MISNMISIVAFGDDLKCPCKIHFNTQFFEILNTENNPPLKTQHLLQRNLMKQQPLLVQQQYQQYQQQYLKSLKYIGVVINVATLAMMILMHYVELFLSKPSLWLSSFIISWKILVEMMMLTHFWCLNMPLTLMMKTWMDWTWRYVIRKILLVFHDSQNFATHSTRCPISKWYLWNQIWHKTLLKGLDIWFFINDFWQK